MSNESGTIEGVEVWNNTSEPYVIVGCLTVEPGATLTIASGVEVQTNQFKELTVKGTVEATGTNFIGFTDFCVRDGGRLDLSNSTVAGVEIEYQPGSHGTVSGTTFGSADLHLFSSGVDVDNNRFSDPEPIEINPSYVPKLYNNIFTTPATIGVSGTAKQSASWQDFSNLDRYRLTGYVTVDPGATLTIASGVEVQTNLFKELTVKGTVEATGTNFIGFTDFCVRDGGRLDLSDSTIAGDEVEYQSGSLGTIRNSEFDCDIKVHNSATTSFQQNSFADAYVYANGDPSAEIDMTQNWWGTTDTDSIELKIDHRPDNNPANRPLVVYDPFLTSWNWGGPEVTVFGRGRNISDGDTTPDTEDGTDFGTVFQNDTGISRGFTVRNDGRDPLSIWGLSVPPGFSITNDIAPLLAIGASDTFTVRLDTTVTGVRSGNISFNTNDPDESPFNFRITGRVSPPQPDVHVTFGDEAIPNNDASPSDNEGTDFGSVFYGQAEVTRTFTVLNDGRLPLTLRVLTVPAGFTITEGLTDSLAVGASDNFSISLNTAVVGEMSGDISFGTNDPDEDPFNFAVTGTVYGPADFGDAPVPYPTVAAHSGPFHTATGPTLGGNRDTETDGASTSSADGDDTNGTPDDEDGVVFGTEIRVGQLDAGVTVNVQNAPSGAKLDAWLDFNGDGSWSGLGERIANSLDVVEGENTVLFDVPSWASSRATYARFRLSSSGVVKPTGYALDGEVEDYYITIVPPRLAKQEFTTHTVDSLNASSLFVADMDGDGDMDVLAGGRRSLTWYENDGEESYTRHFVASLSYNDQITSPFAADMDGDMDIVAGGSPHLLANDDYIAWYENDGAENFTVHTIDTFGGSVGSLSAADVDDDGDMDLLAGLKANSVSDDCRAVWYENDGAQSFSPHTIDTFWHYCSVSAADVDGDGDMDLLVAGTASRWYENDGDERFTSHDVAGNDFSDELYAADLDSDGDMDLIAVSDNFDKILWYENDGSARFTAQQIFAPFGSFSDSPSTIFVVDVDGDGDLDVLSGSWPLGEISWYENDGEENFTGITLACTF